MGEAKSLNHCNSALQYSSSYLELPDAQDYHTNMRGVKTAAFI